MHAAHPLRVALGEVVVHGDDVDAIARERIEVGGADRGQGLALAGLHLHYPAAVKHDPAEDLDVEGPLAEHPPGGLADQGEGLGQKLVESLARLVPGLELFGLLGELLGPERDRPGFLRVDLMKEGEQGLYIAFLLGPEEQGENVKTHGH